MGMGDSDMATGNIFIFILLFLI